MDTSHFIRGATVISVDDAIGNVPNCDVLIEGPSISAVGPNLQPPPGATIIDCTNAIVSPGFIDTHRHTWQTQLRTITTDYVLADYVLALRHIYGSCFSAHDAYIGNLCGALESIDNGITCLVDHSHIMNTPEHADAAVKGLQDATIRATFCYALYENPSLTGSCVDQQRETKTPKWRLQDAQRVRNKFFSSNKPEDLVRFGFAPSEPQITPVDQLVEEIKAARSLGAAVITGHVSLGRYDPGNAVVRQLAQRGVLGPDILLSHGNALFDDELDAVKHNGVGISSTPDTELQMGMSHPIVFKAHDLGCHAALGIDICSNNPADMLQQMRLALQAQRHLEHESAETAPLSISRKCAQILEIATMGGAKAIGLQEVVGSITPGKRADLIITRCDSTRLVPVHDPIGALVLYANASDIDTVFINGNVVKSGGKLQVVDWPEIREELRASAASIMERSKKAPLDELEASRRQMIDMLIPR